MYKIKCMHTMHFLPYSEDYREFTFPLNTIYETEIVIWFAACSIPIFFFFLLQNIDITEINENGLVMVLGDYWVVMYN